MIFLEYEGAKGYLDKQEDMRKKREIRDAEMRIGEVWSDEREATSMPIKDYSNFVEKRC